jgi:LemA protein
MENGWIILIVVGSVLLLLIIWLVSVYNGLVVGRNRYKNAYAQIDVQLKRRYDLIPNLVECVKGYMAHERDTLDAVIKARNTAFNAGEKAARNPGDPSAMKDLGQAEGQLSGALGRLIALSEAYPDLKANTNMLSLQEELTSTENKVGFARQAFNDAVTAFNNSRAVFPTVLVAGMFGFTEAQLFEIEAAAREAPKVSFNK